MQRLFSEVAVSSWSCHQCCSVLQAYLSLEPTSLVLLYDPFSRLTASTVHAIWLLWTPVLVTIRQSISFVCYWVKDCCWFANVWYEFQSPLPNSLVMLSVHKWLVRYIHIFLVFFVQENWSECCWVNIFEVRNILGWLGLSLRGTCNVVYVIVLSAAHFDCYEMPIDKRQVSVTVRHL